MGEPGRAGLAPIESLTSASNLVSARPPSSWGGEFPQLNDGDLAMTNPHAVLDSCAHQVLAALLNGLPRS